MIEPQTTKIYEKQWAAISRMTTPEVLTIEDCQTLADMGSYAVIKSGIVRYFTNENFELEKRFREWEL